MSVFPTNPFVGTSWGSGGFAASEVKELSLPQILEKLRVERPNFPMYLRKFTNPYFIYFNDVEYQNQLYTVYARRNSTTIPEMEFFRCQLPVLELKDVQPTDCGIIKNTGKFNF